MRETRCPAVGAARYSGYHIERLFRFATRSRSGRSGHGGQPARPWFILVPNYVATTGYYKELVGGADRAPLVVAPRRRYQYVSPMGARAKGEGRGCGSGGRAKAAAITAPFVTLWFVMGGSKAHADSMLGALLAADHPPSPPPAGPHDPGAAHRVVVAASYTELSSRFKPARDKSSAPSLWCADFNRWCRSCGLGKLCTAWALSGGCDCTPASPFAHPATVQGPALQARVSQ